MRGCYAHLWIFDIDPDSAVLENSFGPVVVSARVLFTPMGFQGRPRFCRSTRDRAIVSTTRGRALTSPSTEKATRCGSCCCLRSVSFTWLRKTLKALLARGQVKECWYRKTYTCELLCLLWASQTCAVQGAEHCGFPEFVPVPLRGLEAPCSQNAGCP